MSQSGFVSKVFVVLWSVFVLSCGKPVLQFRDADFDKQLGGAYRLSKSNVPSALDSTNFLLKSAANQHQEARALFTRGGIYRLQPDLERSMADFQLAKKLFDGLPNRTRAEDSLRAETYKQIGLIYCLDTPDSCYWYQQKGIDLLIEALGEQHLMVAAAYNSIAGYFAGCWQDVKALELRLKALEISKAMNGGNLTIVAHNNIALLYLRAGNYEKAIEHYQAGLALVDEDTTWVRLPAIIHDNLSDFFASKGDFKEAFKHALYTSQLLERRKKDPVSEINHRLTLGNLYRMAGVPDSALYFYRWEMKGLLAQQPKDQALINECKTLMAETWLLKEQPDSCLFLIDQVINNVQEIRGPVFMGLAVAYRMKGLCYKLKKQSAEAHRYLMLSLQANNFKGDLRTVINYTECLKTLTELGKLKIEQFPNSKESSSLKEGLRYFKMADEAITLQRRLLKDPGSKELLGSQAAPMYGLAVRACLDIYRLGREEKYIEEAFYFAERSKSLNLSEAIQADYANRRSGLPESCLQEEEELKRELSLLKWQRGNSMNENDPAQRKKIEETDQKILELSEKQDRLLSEFDANCSDYNELKFRETTPDIAQLRTWCDTSETSILSYFIDKNEAFVFLVDSARFSLQTINLPPNFDNLLQEFHRNISTAPYFEDDETIERQLVALSASSYELYRLLLEPFERELKERVMIIPDGALAYVPFGGLLDSLPSEEHLLEINTWPFQVKKHSFGYSFSTALLKQMEEKEPWSVPDGEFLWVAPVFSGSTYASLFRGDVPSENLALDFNVKEAETLSVEQGGNLLEGHLASLKNFLSTCSHYRIIHFSTHAFSFDLNSENSFLALQQGNDGMQPLYLWEVLNLRLNTDMVVLSACKTGRGKMSRTEGILSLGRAFAYAGAKSVFMTLWKISDSPWNIRLMQHFYQNIRQGMEKDEAMRKAQIDYLKLCGSSEFAHPHYWAAYAGIGDRSRLFPKR